ncbi:MAG: hypothetical protein ABI345_08155 [Jatrophihabitans sp.]
MSFVFADLITLPLLSIYGKYYGTAITLRILGVFWATMSIAGLAVEYLFQTVGIPDPAALPRHRQRPVRQGPDLRHAGRDRAPTDHHHPIDPERVAHARSQLPSAEDAAD